MRYAKFFHVVIVVFALVGCATRDCNSDRGTVLQGTDTVIVGLYLDKNKYPQANVDEIIVAPGQKIVFAGPDDFEILFKDQRSPIGQLEVKSSNGIVVIAIPENIFEAEQRSSKSAAMKKELVYRYGIRVDGRVTDPTIRIEPR